MGYTKVEYLERISLYYSRYDILPNNSTWLTIRNKDMPTWPEIVDLFGGSKKLKRRVKFHVSKRVWTLDKMREGFENFFKEYGHYPTSPEIDKFPGLPSSRNIQRYYGGLPNLRKLLELEVTDYSLGGYRKKWAKIYTKEAVASEKEVRKFLDERYGEICIHEEKRYGDGKSAMDFFIYAKVNFGIDVFKTSSYKNLAKNVNIKLHKYKDFPFFLYFVVVGKQFRQEKIDILMKKKDKPLSENMKCVTFSQFKNECLHFKPLKINIKYNKIHIYD